jgi:hypothetical protein
MSSSFFCVACKIDIVMVLGSMKDKSVILLKSGAESLTLAVDTVTQGLLIMHPILFVITKGLHIKIDGNAKFDCLHEINCN